MSARRWTCAMCGWSGTHFDAKHTEAGARRCPTCGSGAIVLADPEGQLRNAAGVAKRINAERDKKVPLLAAAGLVEHTDADTVLERREFAERDSALWWRREENRRAADLVIAAEVRARLATMLDPEVLASLDGRVAGLPPDYPLCFWRGVEREHLDGRLARRVETTKAAHRRAMEFRAVVAHDFPGEIAQLDEGADRFHALAGEHAFIWWRSRLRDLLGIPSCARYEPGWRAPAPAKALHLSIWADEQGELAAAAAAPEQARRSEQLALPIARSPLRAAR